MSNEFKTLIVVEGVHTEPVFFKQMQKVFGLNLDIYSLKSNIYRLYKKMKDMDFNGNLKDVLLEIHNTEDNRVLLSQDFAYTYLIFDFDPHHTYKSEKDISLENIINDNVAKIKEMAEYFVDETDPTIGKLYINYPMMESYKDCDSFNDDTYLDRNIVFDDLKQYKSIVGCRKMANKRVDEYTKDDFTDLTRQNVRKLGKICFNSLNPVDYESYMEASHQANILQREAEIIQSLKQIAVLNTASFFTLDYYGNKDGFYNSLWEDLHNETIPK